jgi:hypothetical protein
LAESFYDFGWRLADGGILKEYRQPANGIWREYLAGISAKGKYLDCRELYMAGILLVIYFRQAQ